MRRRHKGRASVPLRAALMFSVLFGCSASHETQALDSQAASDTPPTAARSARIEHCAPMQFDSAQGQPEQRGNAPHARPRRLRAASSIVPFAGGLAVVQDDARFIGLLRGDDALAIVLPDADGRAGTLDEAAVIKKEKLDLESAVVLPREGSRGERLLVLGSGSTKRREWIATIDESSLEPTLLDAHALYERLRSTPELGDAKLNIEGVIATEDRLRLFHRANGKRRGPMSLVIDLDRATFLRWLDDRGPVPEPKEARVVDLGAADGVPFGFTDATQRGDVALFVAVAEASKDAVADGPIRGVRIGTLDASGAHAVDVLEPSGEPSRRKLEGLAFDAADPNLVFAVSDPDDAGVAADRCTVRLSGFF